MEGGPGSWAGKDEGVWWLEDMGRGSGQGSLCSGDVVSGWMSWDQGGVSPWLTGGWQTPWGDPLGPRGLEAQGCHTPPTWWLSNLCHRCGTRAPEVGRILPRPPGASTDERTQPGITAWALSSQWS